MVHGFPSLLSHDIGSFKGTWGLLLSCISFSCFGLAHVGMALLFANLFEIIDDFFGFPILLAAPFVGLAALLLVASRFSFLAP
jgi:hypothetical protein